MDRIRSFMYCLVSVIACLPGKTKPLRFMLGTDPNMNLYSRLWCAVGRKNSMEKCNLHLRCLSFSCNLAPYMSMLIKPKQKYMGRDSWHSPKHFSCKVPLFRFEFTPCIHFLWFDCWCLHPVLGLFNSSYNKLNRSLQFKFWFSLPSIFYASWCLFS